MTSLGAYRLMDTLDMFSALMPNGCIVTLHLHQKPSMLKNAQTRYSYNHYQTPLARSETAKLSDSLPFRHPYDKKCARGRSNAT
jgi:hypothetical protein